MKHTYIVLLKNQHLKFESSKPKKQGHYMKEVRLFKIDSAKKAGYIMEWVEKNHKHEHVTEILDWE